MRREDPTIGYIHKTLSVPPGNKPIRVPIALTEVSTSAMAGTGITDALGDYSVSIPFPEDYTLASKLGYDNMAALDTIELSGMAPRRTVNYLYGRERVDEQ